MMRRLLGSVSVICAVFPLVNALASLRVIRRLPARQESDAWPEVSVLIPARNEARQIAGALRAVLASRGVMLDVVVLDDGSTDETAAIARAMDDGRVRVVAGAALPDGWAGKPHACSQLARAARYSLLLFLDADVRLEPDTIARLARELSRPGAADLISGIPRQIMRTPLEWLMLPMMQVLLTAYLPVSLDRHQRVGMAAACGQLIMARRAAYWAVGGHERIRSRLHDGLMLARAFRRSGYRTGLVDATDLATCRMYETGRQVWAGLSKNAIEGLATRQGLPVWTVILSAGHVLPFLAGGSGAFRWARVFSFALRILIALRYRQGARAVLGAPLGVVLVLAVQWQAWCRHLLRRPVTWKDRSYATR